LRFFRWLRDYSIVLRSSRRFGIASRLQREGRLDESLAEYEAIFRLLQTEGIGPDNPAAFAVVVVTARNMHGLARELGTSERARGPVEYALAAIEGIRAESSRRSPKRENRLAFESEALELRDALSSMPPVPRN
jgi:hypothetical protein